MNPGTKRNLIPIIIGFAILSCYLCQPKSNTNSEKKEIKISYLRKIGEIKDDFSNTNPNFFWNICDLICDDDNNLYVIDSGWNKVFKFSSRGNFISAFGGEGQGPGEFLADPSQSKLRASFGNDKKIYITDTINARLTKFSKEGLFLWHFNLPKYLYDTACVDSKGNFYFISRQGKKIIDVFSKNFNFIRSILNIKHHYKFPFYDPNKISNSILNDMEVQKMVTRNDELIIISNFSLKVFHLDEKCNLLNSFPIDNEIFISDFKQRLKKAVKTRGFIVPFQTTLDNEENLCLFYYNSGVQMNEIYRYKLSGVFLDILRVNERTKRTYCIDNSGKFYLLLDKNRIGIYVI
jgi:hypothetical protein